MEGIYLSNLNAAHKIAAYNAAEEELAVASKEKLEEAKDLLAGAPIMLAGWTDPNSCPNRSVNFYNLMVAESLRDSIGVTGAPSIGGQDQIIVPFNPDSLEKFEEFNPKAFVVLGIDSYKSPNFNSLCPLPLVLKVVDTDLNSGNPKVISVNGKKISDGYPLIPTIPAGSHIVMLKEVPELPDDYSQANVFMLEQDCPALAENAKRGDLYCFANLEIIRGPRISSFFKLRSYQEKVDAIIRQPNKMVPAPSINSSEKYKTYIIDSLKFDNLDNFFDEKFYALVAQDIELQVPAAAAAAADSDDSEKKEKVIIKKGSFIFVTIDDDGFTYQLVPFDFFYQ